LRQRCSDGLNVEWMGRQLGGSVALPSAQVAPNSAIMSSDSNSNPTSSSRKSILLSVPPSALRSNSSTQFLALPHPRSNVPTYFLPTTSRTETATETSLTQSEYLESEKLCDRILELKVIRPEKAQRSWFVATPQKEDQQERDEQRRRKDQDPIQDHGQVIAGE